MKKHKKLINSYKFSSRDINNKKKENYSDKEKNETKCWKNRESRNK